MHMHSAYTTLWIRNVDIAGRGFSYTAVLPRELPAANSRVKWCDHVKNSDIAAITSLPNVNDITAKRRLALLGHVVRLDANTPAHQILKQGADAKSGHRPNAQWRRPPGRPRNSWLQRLTDRHQTVMESCRRS